MKLQDVIINWSGLIKNRKGPYHLVLKRNDEFYFGSNGASSNLNSAYHYELLNHYGDWFDNCQIFEAQRRLGFYKPYLNTAAGDIEITKSDFNSNITRSE